MAGVDLGSIVAHLKLEMQDFNSNLNKAKDQLDATQKNFRGAEGAAQAFSSVGKTLTAGITAPVMAIGASVVKTQMQFEDSMAKVQALSGATGEEFEKLKQTAMEYGESTVFSASECADALGYMALAGWDANESAAGLPGVLNMAAASGMELAEASDMVTDYLTAFGESADQAGRMADVLSYAQANSNTTTQMLGEAFKNCAVNAHNAGMDIEQTTAILGKLADSGLKGSEAGTALNAVIRDMTQKMKNGAIEIGNTKVQVQDANGNFRKMTDIVADVTKATNGMGDAEKTAALMSTFTTDSIKAMGIMCNTGADSIESFTNELYNSDGTAKEMSDTMNNTLSGALKELSSAWEGLQLSMGNSTGILTQIVKGLTQLVRWFKNLPDPVKQVITMVALFAATLGPVIWGVGKAIDAFIKMKQTFGMLKSVFSLLGSGIMNLVDTAITYLYVFITDTLIPALSTLWGVLMANPIILVIAAIAALVAAFIWAWNNVDGFKEFWINLWETIKQKAIDGWNAVVNFFTVTMPEWFNNVIKWFKELPSQIAYWLGYALGKVILWTINMYNKAVEVGTNFVNGVINWFKQLPGRIWNWLVNAYNKVTTWATNTYNKAKEAGKNFIQGVINFIQTLPGRVYTWLLQTITKVTLWVQNMKQKATQAAQGFITNITNGLANLPGKLYNIGVNAVQGLINGIKKMGSSLWNAAQDLASSAWKGMQDALGIHSPSRVMAKEVGQWIPKGVTVGIEANAGNTLKAIRDYANSLVNEIDTNKFLGQVNLATSGININTEGSNNNNLVTALKQYTEAIVNSKEKIDYDKMSIAFKQGAEKIDSTIIMDKTIVGKKTAPTVKERSEYIETQQSRFRGDIDYV